jgi:hypothetical protein
MVKIAAIESGFYRIPLPVLLTDSTHGQMRAFELNTVRVRDAEGAGGVTCPEPDVTNCGGVTVFMRIAHLAEALNLPVTRRCAHDVTVHLLAACPNRSYLEAHGFGLDRFTAEPLRIEDGLASGRRCPQHDWIGALHAPILPCQKGRRADRAMPPPSRRTAMFRR